ncbi:MAG: RNA polymerase sigma factor SigJ [Mycobacteriales bacterium]
MSGGDALALEFERHRPDMRAAAYRMLGSLSEADDAVQEAWIRLAGSDEAAIRDLRAWLVTVVSRICLDMLRARQARKVTYLGTWLPEPVIEEYPDGDAALQAELADSVGLALLVVLETLSPPERLAFILHDVFDVGFDQIAQIIDRTPAAARQLASRGRRRVRGSAELVPPDLRAQRRVVDAFLAAARAGDFDGLMAVLDPDVVVHGDTGGVLPFGAAPEGAAAVAGQAQVAAKAFLREARPVVVNGGAGLVVGRPGAARAVIGFTIRDGRIVEIDVIAAPDKLRPPR